MIPVGKPNKFEELVIAMKLATKGYGQRRDKYFLNVGMLALCRDPDERMPLLSIEAVSLVMMNQAADEVCDAFEAMDAREKECPAEVDAYHNRPTP